MLLLLLQAAALGNVVPLETAPAPMQTLNGLLPLTAYVNGVSQLVSGGSVGSLAGVVTVLLVWATPCARPWSRRSWSASVVWPGRRRWPRSVPTPHSPPCRATSLADAASGMCQVKASQAETTAWDSRPAGLTCIPWARAQIPTTSA